MVNQTNVKVTRKARMNLLALALVGMLILNIGFVQAVGVGSSYWKGSPLRIAAGETKTVNLYLQNMVGDQDITVSAELTGGSEIASTPTREYLVPAKVSDVEVSIEISIPEDFAAGGEYQVTVSFVTRTPGATGAVTLGTGIDTPFDVLVAAEPTLAPEVGISAGLLIGIIVGVIVIILALVVWLIFRARKKRQEVAMQKTKEKFE